MPRHFTCARIDDLLDVPIGISIDQPEETHPTTTLTMEVVATADVAEPAARRAVAVTGLNVCTFIAPGEVGRLDVDVLLT
jgi:hypothetical protein